MIAIEFIVGFGLVCWTGAVAWAGYKLGRVIEKSTH